MNKLKSFTAISGGLLMTGCLTAAVEEEVQLEKADSKTNIIYIMCDDMGYGQLGCYGQKMIQTPNIDSMAKAGMRFTDHYSGTAVCAPSRCALMTGKHIGHAYIRGNKEFRNGQEPIPDSEITVAERLKEGGYRTAIIGKWGLGYPGSVGEPNKQGFDYFFGFNDQKRAHNHYQTWLWKNDKKFQLDKKYNGKGYTQYYFTSEGRNFIEESNKQGKPFFLYLAYTIPHSRLQIPEEDSCYKIYKDKKWPASQKKLAGMITLVDKDVGGILELLKELKIEKNTLVIFTSDNGPHNKGGVNPKFFKDSGSLRGIKRDMYEGGTRVPFIAWWPGTVEAGQESDLIFAHWDLMATACAIAGVKLHEGTDSISYLPTLKGEHDKQVKHEYVYFELHHPNRRALRCGDWVAVQQKTTADSPDVDKIELFNLKDDLGQKNDRAADYPDKIKEFKRMFIDAYTPSKIFPLDRDFKAKMKRKKKQ